MVPVVTVVTGGPTGAGKDATASIIVSARHGSDMLSGGGFTYTPQTIETSGERVGLEQTDLRAYRGEISRLLTDHKGGERLLTSLRGMGVSTVLLSRDGIIHTFFSDSPVIVIDIGIRVDLIRRAVQKMRGISIGTGWENSSYRRVFLFEIKGILHHTISGTKASGRITTIPATVRDRVLGLDVSVSSGKHSVERGFVYDVKVVVSSFSVLLTGFPAPRICRGVMGTRVCIISEVGFLPV